MGKHYVVYEGHMPGVYAKWADCKEQVHGFSGCSYCSFPTKEEADMEFERYVSMKSNKIGVDHCKGGFQFMNDPGSSIGNKPVEFAPCKDVESELLGITMQNCSAVIGPDGSCTIGRFAKGDFLAREDAALIMLRRVLSWTNKEIVDFNHFGIKDLESENTALEARNIDLIVENERLKKEIKILRRKFNIQ
ncbi:hypothetical protein RIF29_16006 [Crotalaria pallida]|uniref:Ribonuclease H1 N-terminal domain-containing protein n=1 Tax=Crotalaria pallida TaxID=3830 RepID=A0AAN9FK63_CROPI